METLTKSASVADNGSFQVLCKAYLIGRHTSPIFRPLPPQTSLWKGLTLRDPKDGSQFNLPFVPPTDCSESVTTNNAYKSLRTNELESTAPYSKSSPLDWLFGSKDKSLSDRVLARLIQSEAHEINVHLREDYRQAFMTVTLAAKGNTMPFVVASYQMYGLHPDKVWPKMIDRRNATLGRPTPISLPHKPEAEPARPQSASVLPFKKKEGIA